MHISPLWNNPPVWEKMSSIDYSGYRWKMSSQVLVSRLGFQLWLAIKQGIFSDHGVRRSLNLTVTILCWNREGLGINSEQPPFFFCVCVFFFLHTAQLHPLWGRGLSSHPRQKTGQASRVTAKGRFVYIQGDLDNIPMANLSCWNSGHTWPTELWFFSSLEAAGLAEALAKRGRRQELRAAEHTTGLRSLSWISERAHYSGLGVRGRGWWHWRVERGWTRGGRGSRQKCPSELLWCV